MQWPLISLHWTLVFKSAILGSGVTQETQWRNGFKATNTPLVWWPRMQPYSCVFTSLVLIYVCKCTFGSFLRLQSQRLSLDNYCTYIFLQHFLSVKGRRNEEEKMHVSFPGINSKPTYSFPFFSWSVICTLAIFPLN